MSGASKKRKNVRIKRIKRQLDPNEEEQEEQEEDHKDQNNNTNEQDNASASDTYEKETGSLADVLKKSQKLEKNKGAKKRKKTSSSIGASLSFTAAGEFEDDVDQDEDNGMVCSIAQ